MAVHTCNHSFGDTEAGELTRKQGQSEIQGKTLSQKTKKENILLVIILITF